AARILMLTVSGDCSDVMRAVEAGAAGYVLKGVNATDLIIAVKNVAAGETFMSPNLSFSLLTALGQASKPDPLATLTPQEHRVLQMVSTGLGNRKIGERLGVREKTVKYHVTNLFRKLRVRNRVEAALFLANRVEAAARPQGHRPISGENRFACILSLGAHNCKPRRVRTLEPARHAPVAVHQAGPINIPPIAAMTTTTQAGDFQAISRTKQVSANAKSCGPLMAPVQTGS